MKFARIALFMLLIAGAPAAHAQSYFDGDPHLQQMDFAPGQVFRLKSAPGYQLMVELSPDEEIKNVALGDASSWQVNASRNGDRLFLKALQPGPETNLTVVTSVRVYNFDLLALASPSPDMPYTVQFRYPPPRTSAPDGQFLDVSTIARRLSKYRVSGSRALRPSSVSDDGAHTYIQWPKNAAIPAIFGIDRTGREVLLNGMMGTDDVYVVDGAPLRLTFRIDGSVARADRINPRKAR